MKKTVAIGVQDYATLAERNLFYIDKTDFIREWWESGDSVTLIARPRRFGKTLNMSMLDYFFSVRHAGRADLFEGKKIWEEERFRMLQGQYPVVLLSFADIKEQTLAGALERIRQVITDLYNKYRFLMKSDLFSEADRERFFSVRDDMSEVAATASLQRLSSYLEIYYGKPVIILLDEYDTPMQEAYINGYWDEIAPFFRALFNSTFKTNPSLDRALMTGITRVARESLFSDLNNLNVVSVTSNQYADAFGFTEQEVFNALEEYGYEDRDLVKHWYDGFSFGNLSNIYNPWSVINYLKQGVLKPYWANTSGNELVSSLIRSGDRSLKRQFEDLLSGKTIRSRIDEEVVFGEMQDNPASVWSLLLASGYLRAVSRDGDFFELVLTNYEVRTTFDRMVSRWFGNVQTSYNDFVKAMLKGDLESMNYYMNDVSLYTFSSFDTGMKPAEKGPDPERFYHGFVLGLLVELRDRYILTSNRESGLGRYDVMLEPRNPGTDQAVIMEFKVMNQRNELTLEDTAEAALQQIEEKGYASSLISRGFSPENIYEYGFAFRGKEILIVGRRPRGLE